MENVIVNTNIMELMENPANINLPSKLPTLESLVKSYEKCFRTSENSKLKMMFLVLKAYNTEVFKQDEECKNFYDFTKKYFDMSKTNTSECLQVARKFGKFEMLDNGLINVLYELDEDYQGYSFSQLYAMRQLDYDVIAENITPDMPVSKIKEQAEILINIDTLPLPFEDTGEDTAEEQPGDTSTDSETSEETEESEKEKDLIGKVNLDELMDRPVKLDGNKKGYVLSLDEDNNLVIKVIL